MNPVYGDLHIHVGKAQGRWVKIPTSKNLTSENILEEAAQRKGLQLIGIVDVLSPWVDADWQQLLNEGRLRLLPGGGYRYEDALTLLPGAEIETAEADGSLAHTLLFLPSLEEIRQLRKLLTSHIRNLYLSSQNAHLSLAQLLELTHPLEPIVIPAHVFTPHKSLFGCCTNRLTQMLPEKQLAWLDAIELGLSSDTFLADCLQELSGYSFLSNSDAHSLDKIAREYNVFSLTQIDFTCFRQALRRQRENKILANYGLDPRLGKYYRTVCTQCGVLWDTGRNCCSACGSQRSTSGVWERIQAIADWEKPHHPEHRPPYWHQIPLSFVPGLGPKAKTQLLQAFGSEMKVCHESSLTELTAVLGERKAKNLWQVLQREITVAQGGGGCYGRVHLS